MLNVRLTDKMIIHLVVAGDVLNGVLFCAVPFPRGVLDEIWDGTESLPENFPTYLSTIKCQYLYWKRYMQKNTLQDSKDSDKFAIRTV